MNTTGTVTAGTVGLSGTAALTMTAGTLNVNLITLTNNAANFVNLNGGTIVLGAGGITSTGGTSDAFKFNGGTLKSSTATTIGGGVPILITAASTVDTTGGNITSASGLALPEVPARAR